jgi:type IV pilus assembly protein PilV
MKSPDRAGISIRSRARGFTLLEVMVALVITAIGLLGIAKIQALAYASTSSANLRSLVALQASGLAASMHANRNYWAFGFAAPIVITGIHITSPAAMDQTATAQNYCWSGSGNTPCSPPTLAAFDLHKYAQALNSMMLSSNPITTITCPTTNNPVSCTINVTWGEHTVSINSQSAASTAQTTSASPGTFAPTYMLYVEP